MTEREKEWAAYQAWKKDFRGPIYFHHWDQWIAEFGFACWQASRRAALEEAWTICNANAAKLKDSKETASGYVACVLTADDIRALAKGDKA
jgi:hypothetical protein